MDSTLKIWEAFSSDFGTLVRGERSFGGYATGSGTRGMIRSSSTTNLGKTVQTDFALAGIYPKP